MKKNEWKLRVEGIPAGKNKRETLLSVDMVTMDKNEENIVTSLGLSKNDNVIKVSSSDFWCKPRNIRIPKKDIMYVLAHNLAMDVYTDQKIKEADLLVAGWFSLTDDRNVRRARNQRIKTHFKKINCNNPVFLSTKVESGVEFSMILLDKDGLSHKNRASIKYTGRVYYWKKGEKNIIICELKNWEVK